MSTNAKRGVMGLVLWALILALSGGQIDYPVSTDFPSESAPVEVEA